MSIKLPIVDMTGKTVGNSGQIKVKTELTNWNIPGHTGDPATIRVLNESGCGLGVWTDTNQINEWLGAGAWIDYELEQGTLYFNWQVQYTIPNPPANQLMITFYNPGERVPPMATLGNSPIGGGTTTAVTGSTLSNEVNATPALIIDIGQVANTNLINIFSDGSFTWNIMQGSVLHTLMKGQIAGNELLLGQVGDIVEILSNLLVDGTLTVTGNSTLGGTTDLGIVTVGGGLAFNGGSLVMNGHTIVGPITITAGMSLTSGDFNYNGHQAQKVGLLTFNGAGSISSVGFGSGIGTGTFTHTLGVTPQWVGISTDVVGSQTVGYDSPTSTNVHITCGAALHFNLWLERT